MRLKAEAGDGDLFSAEKRQRRLDRKRLKREEKKAKSGSGTRTDVFSFINETLANDDKKKPATGELVWSEGEIG